MDEVVEAATELARHRIGALIAFEQDANLDEFVGVHKGHIVDAAVTRELLVALFIPEAMNKLHDGAIVIRNLRIAKAGVFFPMPESRVVDESFGSRHRAAMGITEETDAVVVVVSEERGTISFCFNGNIAANLDGARLRTMLEAIFAPKIRKKKRRVGERVTTISDRISSTPLERSSQPPMQRVRPEILETRGERLSAAPDSQPPPPLRPKASADQTDPGLGSRASRGGAPSSVRGAPIAPRAAEPRPMPTGSASKTPNPEVVATGGSDEPEGRRQ